MVFDSDFKVDRPDQFGANESYLNGTLISLRGTATSMTVASGGDFSRNVLIFTDTAQGRVLEAMTISGERPLAVGGSAPLLALMDASTATGGLTMATSFLAASGTVKLGAGVDSVRVSSTSTVSNFESISGLELAPAEAVSPAASPMAVQAVIAAADKLWIDGATVANEGSVAGGAISASGVLSFTGAGPASLGSAFAIANAAAETAGEALLFGFLGDSYLFVQASTDIAVKLIGVTGVTHLIETGSDAFIVV